jgi:amidohydrolase
MSLRPALSMLLLAGACAALPVHAAETDATALAREVEDAVLAWRRDIHQHPELGNRETRTAKLVADQLRKLGLEVKTGIAHTGVVAVLKGGRPGPKLALRADMDALPVTERTALPFASKAKGLFNGQEVGVMHACGHDSHTAMLLGVATALASMKADLPGEVLFVFQPAEEGVPDGETGGAKQMLAEGVFREFKPDAMFGLHVWAALNANQIGVRPGPTMAASDRFKITVKGRQTHGSQPWGGVDPVLAAAEIVTSSQAIVSRRTNISKLPAVVTFGAIHGGVRFNIIPDEVEMIGTIRTFDEGVRKAIHADLKNVAEHVAAAHGATVHAQVPDIEGTPVLVNDAALVARMRPSLEKAAGAGNVIEDSLIMAAEDFAVFAQQVPSMYFFVGAVPVGQDPAKAPSNHSPEFFLDESALPLGTRAMLQASLDFLNGVGATP